MTFLAALRHDWIDAPWLLDGPINGERFHVYIEKVQSVDISADQVITEQGMGIWRVFGKGRQPKLTFSDTTVADTRRIAEHFD